MVLTSLQGSFYFATYLLMSKWMCPEGDLLKVKQQVGNQAGFDPKPFDLEPMLVTILILLCSE